MKNIDKVVYLHIPKTGGAAMEYFFYDQLKCHRNYFLSFFGHDDSKVFHDELATSGSNHCLIESLWYNEPLVKKLANSPHFQSSVLLFGHTTYSIKDMFPEYSFRFISTIRDPIERTISNIIQLTVDMKTYLKFGAYQIHSPLYSNEYWKSIYDILSHGFPIKGLMRHENLFLQNCMTRIFQGDKYLPQRIELDINKAIENSKNICIANFNDFNNTLQNCMNINNIPIDMSGNIRAKNGSPSYSKDKEKYGKYYNATKDIIRTITDINLIDIELYNYLLN